MRTLLAGLVLLAACSSSPSPDHSVEILSRVSPSVIRVDVDRGHGTGEIVGCTTRPDGKYTITVLTAEHVVKDSATFLVGGMPATVVATNAVMDIAILRAESDLPFIPIELRNTPVLVGEELYSIGFGGGSGLQWVSKGVASSSDRGGSAAPGDSGGAVLDLGGKLVGMIVAIDGGHDQINHHCYFVPSVVMVDWIHLVTR